ncbi:hypothetical protein D5086_030842 [Populus alba]|uniref:Uncharacterized protein n=1 Tax=Populus alba TaxID=43335 RepID=A0ACC4AQF4_POPAL
MHHVGSILGLEFILMSGEHSFGVADKDHERAFFDSADWELGKQGVEKPKGPLEALRPKLQVRAKETQPSLSSYADGGSAPSEDATANE